MKEKRVPIADLRKPLPGSSIDHGLLQTKRRASPGIEDLEIHRCGCDGLNNRMRLLT